ncbi:transcriptional regulator, TetR family [Streptoalloteichus tenebrarius]|uniref:Transcriptional regulator, TetR family n=2 Tax=Streptoalloteichus tenebrarius (strain ATCC 17920 / DSM 40477 / JCM 4838 / CBS 697.72 / NBRC 16177 / NCIMB 11028 / NRRL B-12390 / A12253. 1 / ISP 5477) TaxID=1933 RepID=A0ABT1I3U1_STRSD|nr:transcriptional regulator, TetR family [Streptoalloteichus tenebrarius]
MAEQPVPATGSPAPRVPPNRVDDDTLLDAARECVLAVGVRRTTLTDVARRAGVSRMTLYRRYPDIRTLVAKLMTREFGLLLGQAASGVSTTASARERLVAGAVGAVRLLAHNPLLRIVLDVDPELLLPYVVERIGSTQRLAEQFLREQVVAGHVDGSVRAGDATTQARLLFLTTQSVVLSLRPACSDGIALESLFAELAHQLDAALRPGPAPHEESAS